MDEYIDNRVKLQREWYETNASKNKRNFMSYQTKIIILGALIPVLVAFESVVPVLQTYGGPITAIISAAIAIYAGLDKLKQPQPHWFNYRANEELIKKEEWLFKYKAGPYKNIPENEIQTMFVERIESIISSDIARMTHSKEKAAGKDPSLNTQTNTNESASPSNNTDTPSG